MSGASNEEHSNLYMRGVNEATSGAELDAQAVLDELGAFGEEGVRIYLIGVLEGTETLVEEEIEEYEMLEASIAFEVHQSSVSVLEDSEETLRVRVERVPRDLSTEMDLHIVDDEDEILQGGRIVAVEFEDAADHDAGKDQEAAQGHAEAPEVAPAVVTVEKWKYEIVEYSDPEDFPGG